jgi:polar amino acid transport system substrate-binding protein
MSQIILSGAFEKASDAKQTTIILEGDVWPPYVMNSKEGQNGFIIDVAIAAFAKYGYEVKYLPTPWTRALQDTLDGKSDGVVGVYFSEAMDKKLIISTEEIGISINKFYVKTESKWKYTGVQSLNSVILGVINDYDYGEINQYLYSARRAKSDKVQVLFENQALESNIKKLLAGRIDAIIEDQLVMSFISAKMGVKNKLKEAGISKPSNKVGIAFSPKNPLSGKYAKTLSAGIRKLRASGELKQILMKYGVNDWK